MSDVAYLVQITRQVPNPDYPTKSVHYSEVGQFLSREVTTVTLDSDQWRKVQAAIVEVLK